MNTLKNTSNSQLCHQMELNPKTNLVGFGQNQSLPRKLFTFTTRVNVKIRCILDTT